MIENVVRSFTISQNVYFITLYFNVLANDHEYVRY